jgi:hypothetical protein
LAAGAVAVCIWWISQPQFLSQNSEGPESGRPPSGLELCARQLLGGVRLSARRRSGPACDGILLAPEAHAEVGRNADTCRDPGAARPCLEHIATDRSPRVRSAWWGHRESRCPVYAISVLGSKNSPTADPCEGHAAVLSNFLGAPCVALMALSVVQQDDPRHTVVGGCLKPASPSSDAWRADMHATWP